MYFKKNNNISTQQHLTNGNQTNNVSHTKENINQQLLNRPQLHDQILRPHDEQECCNNLISQKSPYVPAKFRVKINWNTPAYEIPLHSNAAVDNLKREIRLLEERQKRWEIEIKTMKEQIKLTINSFDLTTEERDNFYVNEIQKGEERNVRKWRKHLDKLVNTFNQEQNDTNINNLLKFAGSDTKAQHHSKKSFSITKTYRENITEGNKFVKYPLSSNEINVLKLGLSFTSTPKSNISELEVDIYDFIRKHRLTYHFRHSIYHDNQ